MHTFSDASSSEMGYLMPPILTVGLGRVTLKLTVTHLNAAVGISLGVANVEKPWSLDMLSCVLILQMRQRLGNYHREFRTRLLRSHLAYGFTFRTVNSSQFFHFRVSFAM